MAAPRVILTAALSLALASTAAHAQETSAPSPNDLLGRPAAAFALTDPDGQTVSLAGLRGKVVLLTFWDCYADVCFTSVNVLDNLLRKYQGRPFEVLTVCFEIPPAMAENNYEGLKKSCAAGQKLVLDPTRLVKRLYRVTDPPTTFVIDRNGFNRKLAVGVTGLRSPDFTDLVDQLVKEAEAP